jgi:hypothetical protein
VVDNASGVAENPKDMGAAALNKASNLADQAEDTLDNVVDGTKSAIDNITDL